MQGKACYGECYRELSIGKLGVAYGRPYYRNLDLFRGCLTEQEIISEVNLHGRRETEIGFRHARNLICV